MMFAFVNYNTTNTLLEKIKHEHHFLASPNPSLVTRSERVVGRGRREREDVVFRAGCETQRVRRKRRRAAALSEGSSSER